ncbi:hypothetical protein Musp01_22880 [Muricauda sp. NBRC 101325]|nr:hypothetical protein Musp01_22880 [Muricauda sp. NBRC 101325]
MLIEVIELLFAKLDFYGKLSSYQYTNAWFELMNAPFELTYIKTLVSIVKPNLSFANLLFKIEVRLKWPN